MIFKKIFNTKDQKQYKKKLLEQLQKSAQLTEEEFSMMKGIFTMKEYTARETMIPRVDVTVIPITSTRQELQEIMRSSYHSRFPIYDNNIDDIKGVVHIRDIFKILFTKEKLNSKALKDKSWLLKLSKEPFFIPESRLILDVLKDLQLAHIQMAIVVDEYGGFSGIVTMEDILEEIIGDIQDESDEEMDEIIEQETMVYSVDARLELDIINSELKTKLIDERADTIGGYVLNLFGRIPKKNQSIEQNNVVFRIKTKKGNSVTRIEIDLRGYEIEMS